jgi:hypothetical protein
MSTGYTDREIMDKLNLQERNYQKYKLKIFNASAKAQAQLNESMLITEKDLLVFLVKRFGFNTVLQVAEPLIFRLLVQRQMILLPA